MSAETVAAVTQPAVTPAPITETPAPVIPSGTFKLSPDAWKAYVSAVASGKPTKDKDGKSLLPARYSQLRAQQIVTDAMHAEVTAARTVYRKACMANKKQIVATLRKASVHTVAHRETARGGSLRYVDAKTFKSKRHFIAYRDGVKVSEVPQNAK